jgi:hypothetical protein
MKITLITTAALLISQAFAAPTTTGNSTVTRTGLAPQVSPQFPNLHVSSDALYSYNTGILNVSETLSRAKLNLKNYPEPWSSPDVTHPEIVAAVKAINWDFVPKISVRDAHLDTSKYDDSKDTDCWWTSSGCLKPKVNYLPEDVSFCPRKGEWGLTYDDGPFNFYDDDEKEAKTENKYAEPQLYNYLAEQNLKSTLFVSIFFIKLK